MEDINIGDVVVYKGGKHSVLWIYNNGKAEIKSKISNSVDLVNINDLCKVTI